MDRLINKMGFDQVFLKLAPQDSKYSTGPPSATNILYVVVAIAIITYWLSREDRVPNAPFVTPKSIWDFQWRDAKLKFQADCKDIVNRGFKMVGFMSALRPIIQANSPFI
jgi:hypothetical protein